MDKSYIDSIIARGRATAHEQMQTEHEQIQARLQAEQEARRANLRKMSENWLDSHLEDQVINAIKANCNHVNLYCGDDRDFAHALRDLLKETGYEVTLTYNPGEGKSSYGRNGPEYAVNLTILSR